MVSILLVGDDPVVAETIRRQLGQEGYRAIVAPDAAATGELIDREGDSLGGVIIDVAQAGAEPTDESWEIARRMRARLPKAAIGYLSDRAHQEWAVNGVPGSVLIQSTGGAHDIPEEFFRLCRASQRPKGGSHMELISARHIADTIGHERSTLQEHLQRSPSFIALVEGPEHRFTFANDAYVRLVDREVMGRTVVEAFPEVVPQGFIEILDRVYRTGEEFMAHGIEFWMRGDKGDGRTAYIDLVYRAVRSAKGEICGIFVEGEDLTERRAAQDKIAALQNELLHVSRINAMGLLASALAHEIVQPLAATQNYIEAAMLIAGRQDVDPAMATALEGASDSTMRAGEIIRSLRAMTVRRSVKREPVTIEAAMPEAIRTACLGRHDVRICYDMQATGLVLADPVQLQQLLLNLIRNALEAMGDEEPHLLISTSDEGDLVRCCVTDNGPGISDDVLPRVFDAFATTKPDGMGVGLSVCRMIIETHGGTLSAYNNEDGPGATVCFTLPRAISFAGKRVTI